MNDKQKKFIDQVHRLGEWQHRELYERVEQLEKALMDKVFLDNN